MDTGDREVLARCVEWLDAGFGVELVTVARTWGSSPRPPGSIAAVRSDGVLAGSVSGGCVEKQLSESFRGAGQSRSFEHRIDDRDARRFGLACGGQLDLVFETLDDSAPLRDTLAKLSRRERVLRVLTLGESSAQYVEATRKTGFSYDGAELRHVFGPPWRLLIVGAGQLSRFTAEFAQALDFEVLVVDPRSEFQEGWTVAGIPVLDLSPDEAVKQYADDAQSAVVALSHETNIDDLALLEALPGKAFFVGALGSTRNYERRCERLGFLGVSAESLARLRSPVGLPIGSRGSGEIAVSIMAELILMRANQEGFGDRHGAARRHAKFLEGRNSQSSA